MGGGCQRIFAASIDVQGKIPLPTACCRRFVAMIDIDASSRHTPEGQLENAVSLNLILRLERRMRLSGLEVQSGSRLMFMLIKFAAAAKKNGYSGEEASRGGLVEKPEAFSVKPVPGASYRQRPTMGGRG